MLVEQLDWETFRIRASSPQRASTTASQPSSFAWSPTRRERQGGASGVPPPTRASH
ncbi:unnamed protein product, partial [Ixodes pacificus]